MQGMIPLPDLPLDQQTPQRLLAYFDSIGALLWDNTQKRSFAMYALGLLSPVKRKSVEPIAAQFTAEVDQADAIYQRLLHFLTDAPWPDDAVRLMAAGYGLSEMLRHAPVQAWIFDDTGFLKQGEHSVGVQRQYTGTAGKVANCQTAVSLTVATERCHLPVDMQLYLPQCWTDDPERRKEARIPAEIGFSTKPQMALAMAQRMHAAGVPKGPVLADSAFGDSRQFRHGIRELEMHYAVGIHLTTLVCPEDSGEQPLSVQQLLDGLPVHRFRRYCWREGERGELSARFAFVRVRIPQDPRQELLWLVFEWRDGEICAERAHLTSLPLHTGKHRLVYLLKERWRTEIVYRELKQELGLAHYEGRRWRGWNHHVSVVLCCYAFVVAVRERSEPP
jgi:SRSO17 transposase